MPTSFRFLQSCQQEIMPIKRCSSSSNHQEADEFTSKLVPNSVSQRLPLSRNVPAPISSKDGALSRHYLTWALRCIRSRFSLLWHSTWQRQMQRMEWLHNVNRWGRGWKWWIAKSSLQDCALQGGQGMWNVWGRLQLCHLHKRSPQLPHPPRCIPTDDSRLPSRLRVHPPSCKQWQPALADRNQSSYRHASWESSHSSFSCFKQNPSKSSIRCSRSRSNQSSAEDQRSDHRYMHVHNISTKFLGVVLNFPSPLFVHR